MHWHNVFGEWSSCVGEGVSRPGICSFNTLLQGFKWSQSPARHVAGTTRCPVINGALHVRTIPMIRIAIDRYQKRIIVR